MPLQSVAQLITMLIVFIIVIVMAYFVSKWVGGYQKARGTGTNIEVIETCMVAQQKMIAIVRIGRRYLAVGIGKDEMTLITELDQDELTIRAPGEAGGTGFAELMKKMKFSAKDTQDRGSD